MDREVTLKIILESPTPGVDYGLQEGKGADFKTIQTMSLYSWEHMRKARQMKGSYILTLGNLRGKKILVGIAV
jgi:hypothetical protein